MEDFSPARFLLFRTCPLSYSFLNMPITYNGVGTRYVGHTNAESRPAACPHCRRPVNLTSYDTRLWFVVFFIPIVPLVRKRIIDQCPSCRRHYVMPLDQWEASKQLSISGAMSEFRDDPTPEKAIAAHRQLIGFHQSAQAEEFGQTVAERFPESVNVLLYLGHASDHVGRQARAREYFRRALDLRPDLPEARLAVAEDLIAQGKPDEARPLLDFLEQPGAARVYSAVPLERLGNAYQAAGRHPEALELYAATLREVPAAAQHAGFRKKVRRSEQAAGRAVSMLPKRQFSWRGLFSGGGDNKRGWLVAALVLVLAVVGALGANFWTSRHRPLHVVNDYGQPATVQVDGLAPVQVPPHGHMVLTTVEGTHHATVTGPVHEEVDFRLDSDLFGRWFDHPAWVLNVGGNAILLLQTVHYSSARIPTDFSFHTGQTFRFFPRVNYPFETLPASVQLSKNEHDRALSGLSVVRGNSAGVVDSLLFEKHDAQALDFCEARLRAFPGEPGLVSTYLRAAIAAKQVPRARETLRAGLSRRPVIIPWHRLYQTAARLTAADPASLLGEYDAMLAAAPGDSALLYLRGRLCERPKDAEGYFVRAIAADPKNAWPLFGSAYNHALDGDWKAARPLVERAVRLSPDTSEMDALFFETRLALGENAALETEARQSLRDVPLDAMALCHLTDALSAAGRLEESRQAMEEWCTILRQSRKGDASEEGIKQVRHYVLYSMGDFAGLELDTQADRSEESRSVRLQALIEQGKLDEATALLERTPLGDDKPAYLLAVSIAAATKGDTALAADYRQRARQAFEQEKGAGSSAAALLARTTPTTPADFASFDLDLETKRLLLVSCALQAPGQGAGDARLASTLNVSRLFPYHLLRRVTQDGKFK